MTFSDARREARDCVERQLAADTPSRGGRRIGFVKDEEERARMVALEERLLELARRHGRRSDHGFSRCGVLLLRDMGHSGGVIQHVSRMRQDLSPWPI